MELAIAIKGKLDGSYTASMQKALAEAGSLQQKLGDTSRAMRDAQRAAGAQSFGGLSEGQRKLMEQLNALKKVQSDFRAFAELKHSVASMGAGFDQAKSKTAELAAEFRKSQASTAQLKTQLDQAKNAAQQMKGKVSAEEYRAARAAVKELSLAYKESQVQTKALGASFEASKRSAAGMKNSLDEQRAALQSVRASLANAGYSTQNLAQNEIRLRGELQQTTQALNQAAREQERLAAQRERQRKQQETNHDAQQNFYNASNNFQTGVQTVKTISAPLTDAIDVAVQFEKQMSKVKALTQMDNIKNGNMDVVREEMAALEAQAKELGATTQYTMTQAAEAQGYFAMAGWNAEKIMKGLPPTVNLAIASSTDLARAADIVSDDLTAFGMTEDQVGHMTDAFAYAVNHSNQNLETMHEALKYAAPIASAWGASMEDTTAATMMMANAGVKGSQGGTALRMGLLRLAGPPKKASKALDEMGLSISDATAMAMESKAAQEAYGIQIDDSLAPMDKMSSVIRQLSERFKTMSNDEQLAATAAIFGANAATGWMNIIKAGPDKFDEYRAALEHCDGAAEQTANVMQDNAAGAITSFHSAVEAAQQALGVLFLPTLTELATQGTEAARTFVEWAGQHQTLIKWAVVLAAAIAGVVLAALGIQLVVATWTMLVTTATMVKGAVLGAKAAFMASAVAQRAAAAASGLWTAAQWALNAAMAANPIGLVIVAIAALIAAGYMLYTHFDEVKTFLVGLWESPAGAVLAFVGGPITILLYIASLIIANWEAVKAWFVLLWDDPSAALAQFVEFLKSKLGAGFEWAQKKYEALREVFSHPIDAVVNFISGGDSSAAAASGVDIAKNAMGGIYRRGAFLTTFAEDSAEAAIPLDGSSRAVSLWRQAGEMLGVLPKDMPDIASIASMNPAMRMVGTLPPDINTAVELAAPPTVTTFAEDSAEAAIPLDGSSRAISLWRQAGEMLGVLPKNMQGILPPDINTTAELAAPPTEAQVAAAPVAREPYREAGDVKIEYKPTITIQGGAGSEVVHQIQDILSQGKDDLKALVLQVLREQQIKERRTSFA